MSYPISKTTKVVGVRLENELREIIFECARSEHRQPSDLVREVLVREFKARKMVGVPKEQIRLL